MDDRNAQVGWTDEQWSRIRQAVSEEAHRARVAASFLPTYGPLPPSTQVVPSERVDESGKVDDASTAPIVEIYEEVTLSQQQVNEEELSSVLFAFRRAANIVARVEDRIIFNGQHGYRVQAGTPARTFERIEDVARPHQYKLRSDGGATPTNVYGRVKVKGGEQDREYESVLFSDYMSASTVLELNAVSPEAVRELGDTLLYRRLKATNPGGLGLLYSTDLKIPDISLAAAKRDAMVQQFVRAVTDLEAKGHLAPFICVLGKEAFLETHTPVAGTMVLPSDRIEPILGSAFLRSSVIDDNQGVVLSLAGEPIDLAVAVDASPQFLNVNDKGQYRFRVVERFALRVKDPEAIVRLQFIP